MDHVRTGFQWVTSKSFELIQSMNSKNEDAKKALAEDGLNILVKYRKGEDVTAKEVKKLILNMQQPFQTLEIADFGFILAFYMGREFLPWPLSWTSTVGMVVSVYSTHQLTKINDQINREFYHFSRLKEKTISKEDFAESLQILVDNILSSSALAHTLILMDSTKSYRKLGEQVSTMIEQSENVETVQNLLKDYGMIHKLFV